jgi:EAL and modified HD-GYP domain-containing signal transduction protein
MAIFVARQPIFDREDRLAGYELLYRAKAADSYAYGAGAGQMSAEVIQSLLDIGLDALTCEHTAFVNISRETLLEGHYQRLDPRRVVLELAETPLMDDSVVMACERLVGANYRLALDDFTDDPGLVALPRSPNS